MRKYSNNTHLQQHQRMTVGRTWINIAPYLMLSCEGIRTRVSEHNKDKKQQHMQQQQL